MLSLKQELAAVEHLNMPYAFRVSLNIGALLEVGDFRSPKWAALLQ